MLRLTSGQIAGAALDVFEKDSLQVPCHEAERAVRVRSRYLRTLQFGTAKTCCTAAARVVPSNAKTTQDNPLNPECVTS